MVEHGSYEHLHSSSQIVLGYVEVHTAECRRTSEQEERQQKRGEGAPEPTSYVNVSPYHYTIISALAHNKKEYVMNIKCWISEKNWKLKLELANWNWIGKRAMPTCQCQGRLRRRSAVFEP